MAAVGCGSHSASVVDRSGAVVSSGDVLTGIKWSRQLNDTSTAEATISPQGDCCQQLGNVRAWRHRLLIWRDGEPVWDGPILQVEWKFGQVVISAGDLNALLDRRVPHKTMSFADSDLTDIATWLIDDALEPDDPGHTVQVVGPSRVRGARSYTVDTGQSGDHLRDLGGTGLDYTVIGSTFVLLPEDHNVSVGSLTESDFPEGLTVAEDGASLATRWIVHGDEATGIKGVAGGTDSYYGLLERSVDETSILDNASAASAAESRLNASLPVPVFLSTDRVTLSPDAAVSVPRLVPGWCVDVATSTTCRKLAQRLKITGLQVTEDAEGESIQLELAPTGVGS